MASGRLLRRRNFRISYSLLEGLRRRKKRLGQRRLIGQQTKDTTAWKIRGRELREVTRFTLVWGGGGQERSESWQKRKM